MRLFFLTLIFIGFLYPIDIDGASVNYSFVILPIFCIFRDRMLYKVSIKLRVIVSIFILIFIVGMLSNMTEPVEYVIRRIQSFLIFMTIFLYAFIQVDQEMTKSFKWALISISSFFSFQAIILFFVSGGNSLGYELKDIVGSQRFGFISTLAFWVLFFFDVKTRLQKTARIGGLIILLVGIILTFSRASIVTLFLVGAAYGISMIFQWLKRPRLKYLMRGIFGVVSAFTAVFFIAYLFPIAFEFFNDRIIGRWFVEGGADVFNPETSEGIRIEIFQHILAYVSEHPLTGSGYLGPWILTSIDAGSAHNQFTDIIFRTGLLGATAYAYILFCLLCFFWLRARDFFWGFSGVLVYGIFHETFKESQGAFVLAFMIGMHQTYLRLIPENKVLHRI